MNENDIGEINDGVLVTQYRVYVAEVMSVDTGKSGTAIVLRANPDSANEVSLIFPSVGFAASLARALLSAYLDVSYPSGEQ